MRTLLYSESPINPLAINRHQHQAGLAFEKHYWTFLNSLKDFPISLFQCVRVDNTFVTNFQPLAGLPSLEYLSPLSNSLQLEELRIWRTPVRDISAITHLKHLKKLDLRDSYIEDFTPLLNLPRLWQLRLNCNRVQPDMYETIKRRHRVVLVE